MVKSASSFSHLRENTQLPTHSHHPRRTVRNSALGVVSKAVVVWGGVGRGGVPTTIGEFNFFGILRRGCAKIRLTASGDESLRVVWRGWNPSLAQHHRSQLPETCCFSHLFFGAPLLGLSGAQAIL